MSIKNMKVYYYYPMSGGEKNERIYDLDDLFKTLQTLNIEERILFANENSVQNTDDKNKDIGKECVQLKRIEYNEVTERWNLCFMKNRDDVPFVSKRNGEGHALDLDDDEFVGEEVCLVYDKKTKIIALQNNRYSVSFAGISDFFRQYLEMNELKRFIISPITFDDRYKNISDDSLIEYKSISTTITDLSKLESWEDGQEEFKRLKNVADLARSINGATLKLEINIGRSRQIFLQKSGLKKLVNMMKRDEKIFPTLKVKMLDDGEIRVIDLINYKLDDTIEINVSKGDPKTFDKILLQMNAKFDLTLGKRIGKIIKPICE
ncbi:hypothetical protein SAMN02745248_02394 [Hathewaya proteolytica DSM 3090]|uniref:Uncharacterized protein n=1 Tax=Hathewaya proteolytica DSM 3090 TaxID=1121331 RepID=A0A1M6RYW6_9CLOT|nr:DUF6731 family protein [Hathewaya proteolytica]SHK37538.1 hypothetical protein SAMN02745248_02394 [Hathewaya proteolytica DSM 3090]